MSDRREAINKLLLDPSFRNWVLKADKQDYQYWTQILSNDKELLPLAEEAKAIVLSIELEENEVDRRNSDRALENLQKRLLELNKSDAGSMNSGKGKNMAGHLERLGTYLKLAAILAFFIVAGWLVKGAVRYEPASIQEEISYVEKRTYSGQLLSVKLPDGTNIKLNNNSLLKVPEDFTSDRRVLLEGEAFFEVARNEQLPFRIYSGHLLVEVLGTSFNVLATSDNYSVSVLEGRVRVADTLRLEQEQGSERILSNEQAAAYNYESNQFASMVYDMDNLLWKDGILVFKNQDIRQITARLERWFNVEIQLESEQHIRSHFTAKYQRESLEDILKGMGTVLNFDFNMNNNHVLIKGKK